MTFEKLEIHYFKETYLTFKSPEDKSYWFLYEKILSLNFFFEAHGSSRCNETQNIEAFHIFLSVHNSRTPQNKRVP